MNICLTTNRKMTPNTVIDRTIPAQLGGKLSCMASPSVIEPSWMVNSFVFYLSSNMTASLDRTTVICSFCSSVPRATTLLDVSANTGGGRSGTAKAEADRMAAKATRKACSGIRIPGILVVMAFALLVVALPPTSPLTKRDAPTYVPYRALGGP